jgi:UDP-N-acetylmuramyl pentapeptide phosphotransferase/UDP-N-acetylglucosamine-1-phosphate transferase
MDIINAVIGLGFGFLCCAWAAHKYPAQLLKINFRGDKIPTAYGFVFVIGSILFYGTKIFSSLPRIDKVDLCYLIAVLGFGILGLIDDLFGDRSTGGLKGHFLALAHGKVTTGAIKAIGGAIIAAVTGWMLMGLTWKLILIGFVIGGAANIVNLTDLRPGRAIAFYAFLSIPVIAKLIEMLTHGVGISSVSPAIFALAGAAALYPGERSAKFMLGDTGANALGAALGVSIAIYLPDERVLAAAVAVVLLFHIWTEGHSISRLIENNKILRGIDRKIGVR